ncbi:MAG: hypothetical protein IPL35_07115 [Sphingobacteriales bacterium]|nr:hypothetical protein [Sphingobacteriales bacterium]
MRILDNFQKSTDGANMEALKIVITLALIITYHSLKYGRFAKHNKKVALCSNPPDSAGRLNLEPHLQKNMLRCKEEKELLYNQCDAGGGKYP